MNLILRKPQAKDGEAIHEMVKNMSADDVKSCGGFPFPHTVREDFSDWLKIMQKSEDNPELKEHIFLSFSGDELIGFVRLYLAEALRNEGIVCYYIKPEFRGKGYGVRQMSTALHILKAYGVKKFTISVNRKNKPSKKIIKSLGGTYLNTEKEIQYYQMTV